MEELARESEPCTLSGLAKRHQVSERTIRNDINAINAVLDKQGVPFLDLGYGGTVLVPDGFARVVSAIQESDLSTYRLSKTERQAIAAGLLVGTAGHVTLGSIAEALAVSRATVISDLNGVKALIAARGLKVVSHSSRGLVVEGPESAKRIFLLDLTEERIVDEALRRIAHASGIGSEEHDAVAIRTIVAEQERLHGLSLTDGSFSRLNRYLGTMLIRRLQGQTIESVDDASENRFLAFATGVVEGVERHAALRHFESEVHFLAELLTRLKFLGQGGFTVDEVRIQLLTREFIRLVSEDLGIDLTSDYVFFEMLSNHFVSVLRNDRLSVPEETPLQEMKAQHAEVYDAVKRHMSVFDRYEANNLAEDDIEFVVIHVCAAIERRYNADQGVRVIIACHAGVATSRLMLERLRGRFGFRVVDVMSAHEAEGLGEGEADLVISTIPLANCGIDHVVVQPIPTEEDYVRVGNKLEAIRSTRSAALSASAPEEGSSKELLERLEAIVRRVCPERADELMGEMRCEVRRFFHEPCDADAKPQAPSLHELLSPEHVMLDVECEDWCDAVAQAARPLLADGSVEPRYVEAIIDNTKENGPYYLLPKGFALPHAGLGDGSVRMGMSLVRLAHPVVFDESDEDLAPVEFVCCLSPVDHDSHLRAFFNLLNMLGTTDLADRLRAARTTAEVTSIIEDVERGIEG